MRRLPLARPYLCIWERRTSSSPSLRKLRSRRHLPTNQTRQSTAIRASITPSLDIMGRTTMPPRQRSPTGGQANFYINNSGDLQSREKQFASEPKCVMVTRKPEPCRTVAWMLLTAKPHVTGLSPSGNQPLDALDAHSDRLTSLHLGVSCNWFNWDLPSVGAATFGILGRQYFQFAYYSPPSLTVSTATPGYRSRVVASGVGIC